jgi:hypothetical protein
MNIFLVIACSITATACALSLTNRRIRIDASWAAAGLLVAVAVGAYTALRIDGDEIWKRADAVCVGRGGVAATELARDEQPRVYCRNGHAYRF